MEVEEKYYTASVTMKVENLTKVYAANWDDRPDLSCLAIEESSTKAKIIVID